MDKNSSVAIITINYNGKDFLVPGIKSMLQMSGQYKIFVVDNASTDNSIEQLQDECPQVEVIKNDSNYGFAQANNIGMEVALKQGFDYFLIINNDIEVAPDMLERLLMQASETSVTVPKIYYYSPSDLIWSAGGYIDSNSEAKHRGFREKDNGQFDEECDIETATGCCLLVHRKIYEKIGGFDENYFMYCEDTDWCHRMREAGVQIHYIPSAKMWHKVSSSTGGEDSPLKVYYIARNKLYYTSKFKDSIGFRGYMYVRVKYSILMLLSCVYKKKNKNIWDAIVDYKSKTMGRRGILKKSSYIQDL